MGPAVAVAVDVSAKDRRDFNSEEIGLNLGNATVVSDGVYENHGDGNEDRGLRQSKCEGQHRDEADAFFDLIHHNVSLSGSSSFWCSSNSTKPFIYEDCLLRNILYLSCLTKTTFSHNCICYELYSISQK